MLVLCKCGQKYLRDTVRQCKCGRTHFAEETYLSKVLYGPIYEPVEKSMCVMWFMCPSLSCEHLYFGHEFEEGTIVEAARCPVCSRLVGTHNEMRAIGRSDERAAMIAAYRCGAIDINGCWKRGLPAQYVAGESVSSGQILNWHRDIGHEPSNQLAANPWTEPTQPEPSFGPDMPDTPMTPERLTHLFILDGPRFQLSDYPQVGESWEQRIIRGCWTRRGFENSYDIHRNYEPRNEHGRRFPPEYVQELTRQYLAGVLH